MLTLLLLLGPPAADTWAGFRNDGTSRTAAAGLPLTWAPDTLAWRVTTPGYGQSAPVVWKGTVYVTSVDGPNKETLLVSALDLADGKLRWTKSFPSSQPGKSNPMMSRAAGSPVADAAGLVCLFEGDLIALTHAGAVRWQRNLSKEFGPLKNNHGLGSSPAQTDAHVVVLLDHQGPGKLLAVSKADGTTAWAADRPPRSSWTSPVVLAVGGTQQVVVSSGGAVTGYDAASGAKAWELDGVVGNSIPSPAVAGDRVIVPAGENRMKPDADATSRSNLCLRPTATGYEVVWRAKKLAAGTASPVAADGLAYFCERNGFVTALDLATGEERFRERLPGDVWATPVAADGHVFFFGKDGVTTVLKAGPAFDPVATNRFWSAADHAARAKAEREKAAAALPTPPEAKGPGGGPPVPKGEREGMMYAAVGDVVYGVAAVDRAFVVRTGTEVIRVGR
jgi:outer membrane protein assembly factor BamB